jgi:hypothetical protein
MIDLFVVICSCVFVCSAAMAVKGSTSSGVSIAEIKALLFRAGDRVILPSTPTHARVGASPLRTTMSAHKHGLGLGAAVSPRANRQPTSSLFSPQAIPASVHTNTNIQAQAQAQAPAFASPLVRTQAIVPTSAAAVSRHHSTPMIAHTHTTPQTSTQSSSALAQKSVSTQSYLMSASKLNNIPFSQPTHTDTQSLEANTHTAVSTQSSDTNTTQQANAIAYGHAVANGWRSAMEDRISVHCPLTVTLSNPHTHTKQTDTDTHTDSNTHTAVTTHTDIQADTPIVDTPSECVYNIEVGLFGVIDGHDGSGSAQFLATHLGDVFRSVCTHILTETWTQADCPCTQTHAQTHTVTDATDAAAMDVQPTHTQIAYAQPTANTHGAVFRAMQESPDLWRRILHVVCERLEELLEAEPMMAVKIKDPGYVCCVCTPVCVCVCVGGYACMSRLETDVSCVWGCPAVSSALAWLRGL